MEGETRFRKPGKEGREGSVKVKCYIGHCTPTRTEMELKIKIKIKIQSHVCRSILVVLGHYNSVEHLINWIYGCLGVLEYLHGADHLCTPQ